jgi:hypothetical protein
VPPLLGGQWSSCHARTGTIIWENLGDKPFFQDTEVCHNNWIGYIFCMHYQFVKIRIPGASFMGVMNRVTLKATVIWWHPL